ncbi:phosphatidylserine/phosphatidylglycerophosphate/cardiolipin synthase family protein [Aggregatibacter actinomycetemcomitans]|uniref:phospholipase D-like domain-containing protein n=2 Tax=Aggregatibacter actinomycetemcomitans TaxID=714 RepID=UPI00197C50D8|nr:phospholipase D-like domain-containing protein [Aggregatibacter actinomycetemcomitans]MBN6077116.1 phosphatidylserine/phosphatidylglycerophosphate/cardiolipin synthase family protein [Aggregatibacter actinomycetemcomitans]
MPLPSSQPIPIQLINNRAVAQVDWYLSDGEYAKSRSTFKALINGQETFEALYDKIDAANYSVDIAIWGFQPSMFFRRDGVSHCLGDLLIKKAMQGVKVRVLVWSMRGYIQTFSDANLGNIPKAPGKTAEPGVTDEQQYYDYCWYSSIRGKFQSRQDFHFLKGKFIEQPYKSAFENLNRFILSPAYHTNLEFRLRKINRSTNRNDYVDKGLATRTKIALYLFPSHHQKSVLIDYEDRANAVGFVLEHNMVDSYWDTSEHLVNETRVGPYEGKNYTGNYQDVSSLVSGGVLWDINHNFCQSWDRKDSRVYSKTDTRKESLTQARSRYRKTDFVPNDALGEAVTLQTLRTYDNPNVEDIKRMYLQNITQPVSYIYTENQYFRWPPLAEELKKYWQKLKEAGREGAIYWFVITNSSDEGVKSGSYNTQRMFAQLGRKDALPPIKQDLKTRKQLDNVNKELEVLEAKGERHTPEYAELKRRQLEYEKAYNIELDKAQQQAQGLFEDLSDIGIKVHIATLLTANAWREVYIHSKLTLMDDAFLFLGSANINTRSMQVDSELGIILADNDRVVRELRRSLWGHYTGGDEVANPEEMHDYTDNENIFKKWGILLESNRNEKSFQLQQSVLDKPLYPLYPFFRAQTHKFSGKND